LTVLFCQGFNHSRNELLCEKNFNTLVESRKYFSISDVEKVYGNFRTVILPSNSTNRESKVQFLRLLSKTKSSRNYRTRFQKKMLNSINAQKMEIVMPYLEDTMDRLYDGIETRIQAIIQRNIQRYIQVFIGNSDRKRNATSVSTEKNLICLTEKSLSKI
jgi:hypothetical protein